MHDSHIMSFRLKASSLSDARPCVALIHEMQNSIIKIFSHFLVIRHKNATWRNARIESKSILASCCAATSVNTKATLRNTLCSVIL